MKRSFWYTLAVAILLHMAVGYYFLAGFIAEQKALAEPEYVSVADNGTLAELQTIDGPALVSLAVRFGRTRLIDNVVLGAPAPRQR